VTYWQGTTRYAFKIGVYVVKTPSFYSWRAFLKGLLANMSEADFGSCKKVVSSDSLCPVLFAFPGGLFNIMPYCQPVEDFEMPQTCPPYVEQKSDSFGRLKGQVVAVDYGTPWNIER
jgi:hypothetical protein